MRILLLLSFPYFSQIFLLHWYSVRLTLLQLFLHKHFHHYRSSMKCKWTQTCCFRDAVSPSERPTVKTPSPCRPPTTQWKQTLFSDCVPSNVRLQPSILTVGPSHRGNYMKEEKNRARRTEQFYLFSHFQHTTDLLICLFFFLFPSQILFLFFAFLALFPAFTLLWNSLEPRLVSLYLASFIPTLVLSNRFLNIFQSFPPSSGWFLTNFHSLARFQWKGDCHEAILKERKQEKRAKLC